MVANLELRDNQKSITVSVADVYFKPSSAPDFISLGHAGTAEITTTEDLFTPTIGSPIRKVTPRPTSQSFTVGVDLKGNMDLVILKRAVSNVSSEVMTAATFYRDEKVRIDLSSASGSVPEGNFASSTSVSLYDPTGANEAVQGIDYTVTAGTGTITVIGPGLGVYDKVDALLTYEYTGAADRIKYGGFEGCSFEEAVGKLRLIINSNEERVGGGACKQFVLNVHRARPSGGISTQIKPDGAEVIRVTFEALDDPSKAVGERLYTMDLEQ